jgi:hypothetical protein
MLTKLDRVYAITANKLAAAKKDSYAAGEFADLIHDLADEYEKIDPHFDKHLFLSVADPD